MAFSIRKIISNISYFSKSGDGDSLESNSSRNQNDENKREMYQLCSPSSENIEFTRVEADSTSKCVQSLSLPPSVKNYAVKKGSLSDTDVLAVTIPPPNPEIRKCRKLKLDIEKASQSANDSLTMSEDSSTNVENTPKHKLLEGKCLNLFKAFNFNQSFDISDAISDAMSETSFDDDIDIESLSDHSNSESGDTEDGTAIQMCRKVESENTVPSATPESFADVEIEKNEEERIALIENYQMKIEKLELVLRKLLTDFQFHIEVAKVFNCKSLVSAQPSTDMTDMQKSLNIKYLDNINRGVSPSGWNIVLEKDDKQTKLKVKNQLVTIRDNIDNFIRTYLQDKPKLTQEHRSGTFDLHKGKRCHKRNQVSNKKKLKHYDFPDLREAMVNLFCDNNCDVSFNDEVNCRCCSTESESSMKEVNQSITSSIGNFTLDSTTLSAYSESLDQIISYNSFQDTSLYSTILQKAAIERITFYIQAHSIQLKCEQNSEKLAEFESKNVITFLCPACNVKEFDENGLLTHILSQKHCEKIHFLYKTAYVKKCISSGKEILPSTVLNPMTYYRDENKIVCFGDGLYACSLCFENLIVGESVLMQHCTDEEHINRRDRLADIIE